MFDIAEIQNALQKPSVQLSDLMKLANGSNSAVPGWAALMELNRRKQLEATNTAFNASPPTIKDQLTNAPPAVNPTAAPTGLAPTGAPQLASAVAAPPRMNVAAAPANQVNPTVPPQLAAEGGLLSIPTPHMFKQESYATGGIVAFEGGGHTNKEDERPSLWERLTHAGKNVAKSISERKDDVAAARYQQAADQPVTHPEVVATTPAKAESAAFAKMFGADTPPKAETKKDHWLQQDHWWTKYDEPVRGWIDEHNPIAGLPGTQANIAALKIKKQEIDDADAARLAQVNPNAAAPVAPVEEKGVVTLPHKKTRNKPVDVVNKTPDAGIPTVAPVVAAPVAPAAPAPLPPVKVTDTTRTPYKTLTAEERQAAIIKQADNNKILREKFGISDDPHKADRERMDKLEAKRDGQEKEDSKNELINFFAKASQSQKQNFFAAMGEGAESTGKLTKENAALRDKQAVEMLAARQAMATADDARKRGDMATTVAAEKEAETHTEKAAELGNQFDATTAVLQQADAATTNAATGIDNANTARINADIQKALIPSHQKTADAAMLQSESHWYQVHHPQANEATIKQAMIQRFMKKYGIDEEKAISRIAIAQGAGKSDISDERNLSRERLKANTDWENPMTVANAKKLYGKDLTLPQLKAKFMDGRLSSLPGYTPESGSKATTEAEFDAMPKGTIYTAPDGTRRTKP